MSCAGTSNCDCGCCSGTSLQTPAPEFNRAGLPAISYRTGTWATFRESMLARLSSSDYPALARLTTRDNNDFSIALLDASSIVLDILTFYQERLANENYLRTAVDVRSLVELSRLIGYQPAPGVSSSVYLAFTLKTTPGLPPDPSTPAITIPKGTQVQSVPAQDQKPQIFETSADILAKADWNAKPVQSTRPWVPQPGEASVYLQGTATQLQPGDLVLIVGDERLHNPTGPESNRWDIRVVNSVQPDNKSGRTLVTWSEGLGLGSSLPAQSHAKFYAFRQRASLFGYNAVSPLMLSKKIISGLTGHLNASLTDWNFTRFDPSIDNVIDLDAVYPKIVTPGWVALIHPDGDYTRTPAGVVTLYHVESVTTVARSDFGMSARISRLRADTNTNLSTYYETTRYSSAVVQSEELEVAEQPLTYPLYGTFIDLQDLRPDLVGAKVVAITGKRQRIRVRAGVINLAFFPDDGSDHLLLNPGDQLTVTDPATLPLNTDGSVPDWSTETSGFTLHVEDASGRSGVVLVQGLVKFAGKFKFKPSFAAPPLSDFELVPATDKDPVVEEYSLVSSVSAVSSDFPHTRIFLKSKLLHCYDRHSTTVNANVGLATNGQSVTEVVGNGAAAVPNQAFSLKQKPLTFVQAPTPSGRESTLQVRAGGVAWKEVPSLYQQGPSEQVFATLNQPEGGTRILFGDGVEGATLPTGQNNIQASYRIGSGSAGNVAAGSISILVDRPLGVNGVNNPQDATGGQDAQSVDDIREDAPLSVLTLGRAVSIIDYQNFAASFAGIAKAHALWIPSGPGRGIFLTIAGVGGAALPPGNPTLVNLIAALRNYGNPLIPITAQSFLETLFGLSADVKYDPAFDQAAVKGQVLASLRKTYSFGERTFGQGVSADEVSAVIQAIPGVLSVNVKQIYTVATSAAGDLAGSGSFTVTKLNQWLSQQVTLTRVAPGSASRICAYLPVADAQSLPLPAEVLVLDPDPKNVLLGVMP
jgi:baseplate J-like protein